jgi:CRP/FNR family transcriptional regulator, dissimilatory nitrate respiration regulator
MQNRIKAPMDPQVMKFSRELVRRIGRGALSKNCSKGVYVFREGDRYMGPWVLIKGVVLLVKTSASGKEQIVRQIEPGEVFAEVPLFKGIGWYPIHARCAVASELLRLPVEKVRECLTKDPQLAWMAACSLAGRIADFRETFFDLTLADAQKRLLRYLVRRLEGKPNPSLGVVRLGISHQDLALLLGIRPESLSRGIKELEKTGKMRRLSRQTFQLFPTKISADELDW